MHSEITYPLEIEYVYPLQLPQLLLLASSWKNQPLRADSHSKKFYLAIHGSHIPMNNKGQSSLQLQPRD